MVGLNADTQYPALTHGVSASCHIPNFGRSQHQIFVTHDLGHSCRYLGDDGPLHLLQFCGAGRIVQKVFAELTDSHALDRLKRRLVKSPEEIQKLKDSLEIAEAVEETIFSEIRSDWSVFKLASRSKQLIYELGGTGVDHATISIGKSNPEILEDLKGSTGDIVVLDVGAILDGYVSDTRRLAHFGKIPEDMKELNGTMTRRPE